MHPTSNWDSVPKHTFLTTEQYNCACPDQPALSGTWFPNFVLSEHQSCLLAQVGTQVPRHCLLIYQTCVLLSARLLLSEWELSSQDVQNIHAIVNPLPQYIPGTWFPNLVLSEHQPCLLAQVETQVPKVTSCQQNNATVLVVLLLEFLFKWELSSQEVQSIHLTACCLSELFLSLLDFPFLSRNSSS